MKKYKKIRKLEKELQRRNKLTSSLKLHFSLLKEFLDRGKISKLHYNTRVIELGLKQKWNQYKIDKILNKFDKLK